MLLLFINGFKLQAILNSPYLYATVHSFLAKTLERLIQKTWYNHGGDSTKLSFMKNTWLVFPVALAIASCGTPQNKEDVNKDSSTTLNSSSNNPARSLEPKGAAPAWAPDMKDRMLVVIEKLQSYNAPPIETLSAQQARLQPTPAMAVMDVIKENNVSVPAPKVNKMDKDIQVNGTTLQTRVYTPTDEKASHPLIVYYHGGGWVIADLNTYDASAQALAEKTGSVVVSVHYRQGPENKFPTAHNDAFAAYQWVLKNADSLKGDANNISVVGESAGGNLACNVSIMARDKGVKMPVAQVLVYPVANNDMNNASYTKYAAAKPLNKPMMEWFAKNYLNNMSEAADPRISLVKAKLNGLPPTMIILAEIDPLHDEGKLLADKLEAAGVKVTHKDYSGVTHEFFGMGVLVPQAMEAEDAAANFLTKR